MGAVVGVLILAIIAVALFRFQVRLPLKAFFSVTTALLYFLAMILTGKGVHELQEAGWISTSPVSLPEVPLLGIFATSESLLAQGLMGIALILALAWIFLVEPLQRWANLRKSVARIQEDLNMVHEAVGHVREHTDQILIQVRGKVSQAELKETGGHLKSLHEDVVMLQDRMKDLNKDLAEHFEAPFGSHPEKSQTQDK